LRFSSRGESNLFRLWNNILEAASEGRDRAMAGESCSVARESWRLTSALGSHCTATCRWDVWGHRGQLHRQSLDDFEADLNRDGYL